MGVGLSEQATPQTSLAERIDEGGPGSGRFPRDPSKPTSRYYVGPKGQRKSKSVSPPLPASSAEPTAPSKEPEKETLPEFPPLLKVHKTKEISARYGKYYQKLPPERREIALRAVKEALESLPPEDVSEIREVFVGVGKDVRAERRRLAGWAKRNVAGFYAQALKLIALDVTDPELSPKHIIFHEVGHAVWWRLYDDALRGRYSELDLDRFWRTQYFLQPRREPLTMNSTRSHHELFAEAYVLYHSIWKFHLPEDSFRRRLAAWFDKYYATVRKARQPKLEHVIKILLEGGPGSGRFPRDPSKPTSRYYVGPRGRRQKQARQEAPSADFSRERRFLPPHVRLTIHPAIQSSPEMTARVKWTLSYLQRIPKADLRAVKEIRILPPDEFKRVATEIFGEQEAETTQGWFEFNSGTIVLRHDRNYALIHEIGHAFLKKIRFEISSEEERERFNQDWTGFFRLNRVTPLSGCALSSPMEFFAEAYAIYHFSLKGSTKPPRGQAGLLKRSIKEWFDNYYSKRENRS